MKPPTIRRARAEDAAAVTALVNAAYERYLTRMPRRPAPMDDDHAAAIATKDVWVAELPGRAGEAGEARASDEAGAPASDERGLAQDACNTNAPQEIVGVIVIRRHDDHLLVENVAVHPDAQGHGIGGRLLDVADEFAGSLGISTIRLYTNAAMTENITYYPRHGYLETHRAVDEGFSRIFFERRLNP